MLVVNIQIIITTGLSATVRLMGSNWPTSAVYYLSLGLTKKNIILPTDAQTLKPAYNYSNYKTVNGIFNPLK